MRTKKTIFKISFCLLIATCLCSCFSLKLAPITQTTFEKIIDAPNVSKNDLYISVNEWFVKQFTSAKSVIQFQDKEEGKIVGKYVSELTSCETMSYYFESTQIISVDIRENKIRLSITNPCIAYGMKNAYGVRSPLGACVNTATEESQLSMNRSWENLAHSLEEYVNNSSSW